MFWWILMGVCGGIGIFSILYGKRDDWDDIGAWFGAGLGIAICIALLLVCILAPLGNKKSIAIYEQQKTYCETHIPDNEIEDAALTQTKIELNGWLYNAQYMKENYPFFSFMPDEVLDLEPIE